MSELLISDADRDQAIAVVAKAIRDSAQKEGRTVTLVPDTVAVYEIMVDEAVESIDFRWSYDRSVGTNGYTMVRGGEVRGEVWLLKIMFPQEGEP